MAGGLGGQFRGAGGPGRHGGRPAQLPRRGGAGGRRIRGGPGRDGRQLLQGALDDLLLPQGKRLEVALVDGDRRGGRHLDAATRPELGLGHAVGGQQVRGAHVEVGGHLGQRIPLADDVRLEVQPLAGGDARQRAVGVAAGAGGDAQRVAPGGRRVAEQLRIEILQLVHVGPGEARQHAEARHAVHVHGLVGVGRHLDHVEPVALRETAHQDRGQQLGHVVLGLVAQVAAPGHIPEVVGAKAARGPVQGEGTRVVAGHGQVPVAAGLVEVPEIAGGSSAGLHRIAPFLDPGVAVQAEEAASGADELPHAHGLGRAPGGVLEAGLDEGQVREVLGHPLLLEDLARHGQVLGAPGQGALHEAPQSVGEVVDPGEHLVVQVDGKVEHGALLGRLHLGQLRLQVVAREAHGLGRHADAVFRPGGVLLVQDLADGRQPLQEGLLLGLREEALRQAPHQIVRLVGPGLGGTPVLGPDGLLGGVHEELELGRAGLRRRERSADLGGRRGLGVQADPRPHRAEGEDEERGPAVDPEAHSVGLGSDVGLVGGGVEQLGVHRALQADLDHPALGDGILVHVLGVGFEVGVDLGDLAGGGHVALGDGLHGLDRAELVAGAELLAHFGQVDEDHVTQGFLGVVGDADDGGAVAQGLHELVVLGVFAIGGEHGSSKGMGTV